MILGEPLDLFALHVGGGVGVYCQPAVHVTSAQHVASPAGLCGQCSCFSGGAVHFGQCYAALGALVASSAAGDVERAHHYLRGVRVGDGGPAHPLRVGRLQARQVAPNPRAGAVDAHQHALSAREPSAVAPARARVALMPADELVCRAGADFVAGQPRFRQSESVEALRFGEAHNALHSISRRHNAMGVDPPDSEGGVRRPVRCLRLSAVPPALQPELLAA